MRRLFNDPAPALDALRAEYGPICGLGYPGVRLAIIGDPASMHEMFSMKADAFRWNHKFNVVGVRFVVGKQSMIVSDGADHQRRRGAGAAGVHSASPQRLDPDDRASASTPRSNGCSPPTLTPTDPVDLYPIGRDLILGITVHAFFGERTRHENR